MFLHNKRLMYTVRVDQPNPLFAKLLLEQFGGPNGELSAAMRYFTQAWNEPDPQRRSLLADIATEELSHLEMVGQALVLLQKGSPAAEIDKVEGDYLGDLLGRKPRGVRRAVHARSSRNPLRRGADAYRLVGKTVHRRLGRHHRRTDRRSSLRHRGRSPGQDHL